MPEDGRATEVSDANLPDAVETNDPVFVEITDPGACGDGVGCNYGSEMDTDTVQLCVVADVPAGNTDPKKNSCGVDCTYVLVLSVLCGVVIAALVLLD